MVREDKKRLIEKMRNSGFYETSLDDILKRDNVSNLLLTGINAGACILDTAIDGLKKGYTISTGWELILDHNRKRYEKSVEWFKQNGIWINNPIRTLAR